MTYESRIFSSFYLKCWVHLATPFAVSIWPVWFKIKKVKKNKISTDWFKIKEVKKNKISTEETYELRLINSIICYVGVAS